MELDSSVPTFKKTHQTLITKISQHLAWKTKLTLLLFMQLIKKLTHITES
jgi:hypothetical protein